MCVCVCVFVCVWKSQQHIPDLKAFKEGRKQKNSVIQQQKKTNMGARAEALRGVCVCLCLRGCGGQDWKDCCGLLFI